MDDGVKVEAGPVVKPKVDAKSITTLSPEHYESRQRAHELKVAKFLAGGEF